jgi:hypothetical protein
VIPNRVINLSVDKPAVLAEMYRVLTPGGRIGIADVVAEDHLTPADPALLVLGALDAAGLRHPGPALPGIAAATGAGPAVTGLLVASFPGTMLVGIDRGVAGQRRARPDRDRHGAVVPARDRGLPRRPGAGRRDPGRGRGRPPPDLRVPRRVP